MSLCSRDEDERIVVDCGVEGLKDVWYLWAYAVNFKLWTYKYGVKCGCCGWLSIRAAFTFSVGECIILSLSWTMLEDEQLCYVSQTDVTPCLTYFVQSYTLLVLFDVILICFVKEFTYRTPEHLSAASSHMQRGPSSSLVTCRWTSRCVLFFLRNAFIKKSSCCFYQQLQHQ